MYVRMHVCVYVCVFEHVQTYVYVFVYMYVYNCICVLCICMSMYVPVTCCVCCVSCVYGRSEPNNVHSYWHNCENYRLPFSKYYSGNCRVFPRIILELQDDHRHDLRTLSSYQIYKSGNYNRKGQTDLQLCILYLYAYSSLTSVNT